MTNNVIRLPFGQRKSQSNHDVGFAVVSSISAHLLGQLSYLIKHLTLNLINYKKGVICLSFTLEPSDREWLQKHEAKARLAFGKICSVSKIDGSGSWEIRQDMPIFLEFPEDHADRLRAVLVTDETHNATDEEKGEVWEGDVLVTYDK